MKSDFDRQFALKMPHKDLKWPKIPCLRIHIPCPALILDAHLRTNEGNDWQIEWQTGSIHRINLKRHYIQKCLIYSTISFFHTVTEPWVWLNIELISWKKSLSESRVMVFLGKTYDVSPYDSQRWHPSMDLGVKWDFCVLTCTCRDMY